MSYSESQQVLLVQRKSPIFLWTAKVIVLMKISTWSENAVKIGGTHF